MNEPFELRGVVHLIRPWGTPARDLEQLLRGVSAAPDQVLFRHAVQHQLRHPGAEELPPDDFTSWIAGVVQDTETAERLSFAVQTSGTSPSALRERLVAVLETVPAKKRAERDAPEGSEFLYLSATSMSFPTGDLVHDANELTTALMSADAGVWFFHLVEQPFFGAGRAPLLDWLEHAGEARLAEWLGGSAGSGLPIDKARARLLRRWRQSTIGRRLARSSALTEEVRRESGRQAVARLVRRSRGGEA